MLITTANREPFGSTVYKVDFKLSRREDVCSSTDFSTKGVVQLSMAGLIEEVFLEYPVDEKKVSSPAAHHLFEVNELSEKLPGKEKESFHSAVAKLLYIAKRARYIQIFC